MADTSRPLAPVEPGEREDTRNGAAAHAAPMTAAQEAAAEAAEVAQAIVEAARRTAVALSPAFVALQETMRAAWAPWAATLTDLNVGGWFKDFSAVALQAQAAFTEFQQTLARAGALGALGWTVPLHADLDDVRHLLTHANDSEAADAVFTEFYERNSAENRKALITELLRHPRIGDWRPLVEEVAFCIEAGKYRIAVPALLSILEGVSRAELGALLSNDGERAHFFEGKVEALSADHPDRHFWTGMAAFTAALYRTAKRTKPLLLNRHWILHGRGVPDGKFSDCMRLLQGIHSVLELAK